jgi:mannose-6-phosphate isomerase-like protein (cupin superfamily)
MPAKRYRFVPPGGGPDYDWTRDHTTVKVAAADTGGAYALMEDNLKREFALGLHLHRHHAETFYILDGVVNFHIDGDWMAAEPGACVHIPPGVPHALDLPDRRHRALLDDFSARRLRSIPRRACGLERHANGRREADGRAEPEIRHRQSRRRAAAAVKPWAENGWDCRTAQPMCPL